ncbi:MAG: 2-C-methyl-D-erythritol 2,4-cyclodiphosphate synthase [Actinobacteria bacterium]|nr:2-C-methyl-D-erythritol 2,4-cyclodiphosphate synthase [Actinomycetota bacterium]
MRIGMGVDAHAFEKGRKLFLGGEEIPFDKGLAGYSDADVLLHALMDALLGACGAGDIGELFPDNDPKYYNISSVKLLSDAYGIVKERGFMVVNADLTLVCEEPKIRPFRESIKGRIASVLEIETDLVSVKGTTTECLGFTGRKEGIMALAVVLVDNSPSS